MQRVTIKTSTIFIAKRGRTKVYHSVNEVPPNLRKELEDTTNSLNSATILIADRRGRDEILRILNGLPTGLRSRLASSLNPRPGFGPRREPAVPAASRGRLVAVTHAGIRFVRNNWLEMLVPGAVGLILWLAFNYR